MDTIQNSQSNHRPHQSHSLTLAQYVQHHNGVPLGHPKSLHNMLYRSFGAGSFAKFWQYWNPIWGYGLGKFVHTPLQHFLPPAPALIVTFIVSGGIHDLATMAVRGSAAFLFTPWFFLLGIGVVLGRMAKMDLSRQPRWLRVAVNLTYLSACLAITILVKQTLNIS